MPIPVHTDLYLVQHVMRPDTLPESNSFVNTWFFNSDTPGASHSAVADLVKTVLDRFYNGINAPATFAVSGFFSAIVDPALTEYRVYDLGDTPPRTPLVRDSNMAVVNTGSAPNEVAAVMSFRSGPGTLGTGGTINPRRRGRLYLGPLSSTSWERVSGSQDVTFISGFTTAILESAETVMNATEAITWMQYSRVEDVANNVSGGFVNNAPDTQRRRGAPATARVVF